MTVEERINELDDGQDFDFMRGDELAGRLKVDDLVSIARYAVKLLREIDDDDWGGQHDADDWLARNKCFLETGIVPPEGNTKGKVGDGN
jgi:hypothetical protein